MKINRKKFFENYKLHFGKLSQPLADNLNFLLGKMDTGRFQLPSQMAYMFATLKVETNETYAPVIEGYWLKGDRELKLYRYYKIHNSGALKTIFPNVKKNDEGYITSFGKTYEGRGFVQCTHFDNYKKFGLQDNPDKALEPETAFMIMEKGMTNGMFTGKTLQHYISDTAYNPVGARKVINGIDRNAEIAEYCDKFIKGIELVADDLAMAGYKVLL